MQESRYLFGILTLLCLCISCSPPSPEAYLSFIEQPENGFIQHKQLGELSFSAAYRPPIYVALRERADKTWNPDQFQARLETLSKSQHFRLRISVTNEKHHALGYGLRTSEEVESRRQYLMFQLAPHIQLICRGDTLACKIAHFEQNYGLSPHADINLVFPQNDCQDDKQLLIRDIGYQTGILKFTFSQASLQAIPNPTL